MRKVFLIAGVLAVASMAAAGAANAGWLDVLPSIAGYTYYPNIRDVNGRLNNLGLTTDPQAGELTIDDGTGVVLTTPTTAAAIKGAPMAAGSTRGGVSVSLTNGTITLTRSGLYRVGFSCGEVVGVNSQDFEISVFSKVGSGSAAELSPSIECGSKQPATALPVMSCAAEGFVSLSKGDSDADVVLDFRASADTGNFTCKRGRFYAYKYDELAPPTPRQID